MQKGLLENVQVHLLQLCPVKDIITWVFSNVEKTTATAGLDVAIVAYHRVMV